MIPVGNQTPRRGKKQSAQGIALGKDVEGNFRPIGAKAFLYQVLLPIHGVEDVIAINPGCCPGLVALWPFRPFGKHLK